MQITVKALRAKHGGAEVAVTVTISDGTHAETRELLLTAEQYAECKPKKGSISEEKFERLETAAQFGAAVRKGSTILGYGANSKQMLIRKLRSRGFDAEQSVAAAEYLANSNCLNEAEDAVREAEICIRKLWGRRRIIDHLRSRGYGKDVLASLEPLFEQTDFEGNCRRLIEKRYRTFPTDRDGMRKLYAALFRYGYSSDEIRSACADLPLGDDPADRSDADDFPDVSDSDASTDSPDTDDFSDASAADVIADAPDRGIGYKHRKKF